MYALPRAQQVRDTEIKMHCLQSSPIGRWGGAMAIDGQRSESGCNAVLAFLRPQDWLGPRAMSPPGSGLAVGQGQANESSCIMRHENRSYPA
jgi:hypothetical protein